MRVTPIMLVTALSALAASCNDGGNAGAQPCTGSFAGRQVQTSDVGCPNCSIVSPELAADGHGESYAEILIGGVTGGTVTLRATGAEFGAGSFAGAHMLFPRVQRDDQNVGLSLSFHTYLGGVPRESSLVFNQNSGNPPFAGTTHYYGFDTSMSFDAVETVITRESGTTSYAVREYEVCGQL